MSWLAIKKYFKKAYVWCVQHWRWLVFAAVALIAYFAGRKNARMLWIQAELARKQYKREAEAIEKEHADKDKRIKKAEEKAQRELVDLKKAEEKAQRELEVKKRREMMKIIKDSDAIDSALKDSGIKEV